MKTTNPKKQNIVKMPLVHPDAAGIDVGDTIHAVAVPEGRDEQRVRSFGAMTCDLEVVTAVSDKHRGNGKYWSVLEAFVQYALQGGF